MTTKRSAPAQNVMKIIREYRQERGGEVYCLKRKRRWAGEKSREVAADDALRRKARVAATVEIHMRAHLYDVLEKN